MWSRVSVRGSQHGPWAGGEAKQGFTLTQRRFACERQGGSHRAQTPLVPLRLLGGGQWGRDHLMASPAPQGFEEHLPGTCLYGFLCYESLSVVSHLGLGLGFRVYKRVLLLVFPSYLGQHQGNVHLHFFPLFLAIAIQTLS